MRLAWQIEERECVLFSGLAGETPSHQEKSRAQMDPANDSGGDDGARTHGLRLAKPALSQLSYVPFWADARVG